MNKGKNINELTQTISEYNYNTRRVSIPDWCPLYAGNTPCHTMDNMENFNCLECYSSCYDTSSVEGGCLINNSMNLTDKLRSMIKGKWHYHSNFPTGRIWDCSDCIFPHDKNNLLKYFRKDIEKVIESKNKASIKSVKPICITF